MHQKNHSCSGVSPDDVDPPIDPPTNLHVYPINVLNYPPEIDWNISPCHESYVKDCINNIYYIYNGSTMTFCSSPHDRDNNVNELSVVLYDNGLPTEINGTGAFNKQLNISVPGRHVFSAEVTDNRTKYINESLYVFEVLNYPWSYSERCKVATYILIISIILGIVFIPLSASISHYAKYFRELPESDKSAQNFKIVKRNSAILSILVPIIVFSIAYLNYIETKIIPYSQIYIYITSIYTIGFIISTKIIVWRITKNAAKYDDHKDSRSHGFRTHHKKNRPENRINNYDGCDWIIYGLFSIVYILLFYWILPILNQTLIRNSIVLILSIIFLILAEELSNNKKPKEE